MTDKELKRLGRAELIDIVYELQLRNEQCQEQIAQLQAQLDEKLLKIENAGSIAEAAIAVNKVVEAAQAAADQYLESIHAANAGMDKRLDDARRASEELLAAAEKRADEIVRDAEFKGKMIVEQAQKNANEHWDSFQKKADELIRAHEELSRLVKKD